MDDLKYFWDLLWGTDWTGIESVGRWLVLALAATIIFGILSVVLAERGDKRFIDSCYARGGHVHFKTHPGVGVIVGNVVVPTSTYSMKFAPGKEEDCDHCR